jgi:hypothetical protein
MRRATLDNGAARILWNVPSFFSCKKLEAKVRTMKKTPKMVYPGTFCSVAVGASHILLERYG